jgi:hypothetical protein
VEAWRGKDFKCSFCDCEESIDHLFFTCPLARYLWSILNCAFCLPSTPVKFEDLGLWVWNFPSKIRTVVAALVLGYLDY